MKKNKYVVILAGGKGERLWPLSRQKRPKQLLPFCNDLSLLEQTINRVQKLVTKDHLWIVTTQEQEEQINQLVGDQVGKVLAEPASRNTAPAILLTCLEIAKKDENALVLFLPADHFITQDDVFQDNLKTAFDYSWNHNVITLLGLNPEWAATGYGYIEFEKNKKDGDQPQRIVRFHEKPSAATAEVYVTLPNMLWNIGVFCAKATVFLKEYEATMPSLLATIKNYLAGNESYDRCDNISVDHAVIEKSTNTFVLPVSFAWSDVGNLDTFISLHAKHKEAVPNVVTINAHNNVLNVKDKLVALIDVDNLCVVQTDDVLLIAQRDQTDKVKQVISLLKKERSEHLL